MNDGMNYGAIGRWLVGAAAVLAIVGGLLLLLNRFGVNRLPGDIVWRREGLRIYVPLGLMILVSVILTILFNIVFRVLRK